MIYDVIYQIYMKNQMSNTKKILLSIGISLVVLVLMLFIWWMGGYNFDHRDENVGMMTAMTIFLSTFAGMISYAFLLEP